MMEFLHTHSLNKGRRKKSEGRRRKIWNMTRRQAYSLSSVCDSNHQETGFHIYYCFICVYVHVCKGCERCCVCSHCQWVIGPLITSDNGGQPVTLPVADILDSVCVCNFCTPNYTFIVNVSLSCLDAVVGRRHWSVCALHFVGRKDLGILMV